MDNPQHRHRGPALGAAAALALILVDVPPARSQAPPPSFEAEVRPAGEGEALAAKQEHCSADPDRLAAIGAAPGRQARVYKDATTFALFTLQPRDERPETVVRMGASARKRFGKDPFEAFSATVAVPVAPRSELSDAEADTLGELVERLDDDGSHTGLLIMAPHGGEIEPSTDLQAARLMEKLGRRRASSWVVKGFDPPGPQTAFGRWHITATDMHEASYPLLARAGARKYDYAVSFHGKSAEGLLIGGAGPMELKEEIRDALAKALGPKGVEVVIARPGQPLGGSTPTNIVNRYTANGIQMEQGPRARREHWREIADVLAEVYRPKLGPEGPEPRQADPR